MQLRLPGRRSIVAHAFPSSDEAFAATVSSALEAEWERCSDADELRAAVTRALRRAYPDARLVVQDDLARLIPSQETWYVFRDDVAKAVDPAEEA